MCTFAELKMPWKIHSRRNYVHGEAVGILMSSLSHGIITSPVNELHST